jgi:hypothetical protein
MAFKEIAGIKKYRSWKLWNVGDFIIGTFQGSYTDNFGKPGYTVEIEECSFENKEEVLEEGTLIGLNNCRGLSYRFEQCHPGTDTRIIQVGTKVRIEYQGMDKVSNKKSAFFGKDCHQVSVQVDEETLYNFDASKIKEIQDNMKKEEPKNAGDLTPDETGMF